MTLLRSKNTTTPWNLRKQIRTATMAFLMIMGTGAGAFAGNPPDEGMWLPLLLERLNYIDMQKMGLHLTAEEIYNINNSSLKDAIVGLSGGGVQGFYCTAEVVSDQGLIFTNHHCGYGSVQNHSTTEHDYLTNGFWAKSKGEELPNENMCASFLIRIENVTDSIIPFLSDTLSESARTAKARELTGKIRKRAEEKGKYEASVKSFFAGNEYYLFVYKTYRDVRLVGAPPSSIGKFGGDTDNWMWPRHTCDFTVFRIYGDGNNEPADFAEANVPIKPKYHLPISLNGVKKDDFAMIWGFPGTTTRYLTSYGIEYSLKFTYPALIKLYGKQLDVMKEEMDRDKAVKIAYSDNYANIANTWKNFIGASKMLKRNNVVEKKKAIEDAFTNWINSDPFRQKKFGNVLDNLKKHYEKRGEVAVPNIYANLAGASLDIVQFAGQFGELKTTLDEKDKKKEKQAIENLKGVVAANFTEKYSIVEKNMLAAMLKLYAQDVPKTELPDIFLLVEKKYKNDFYLFADEVYKTSVFASAEAANKFLEKPNKKIFKNDLGWLLAESMGTAAGKYQPVIQVSQSIIGASNRAFVSGIRQMNPALVAYPDANSTLRFSFGKVLDYYPADAAHYNYITTLKGVMEKEDPTNEEFIVEQKLKDLYKAKDYGQYGENGEMIVCFLTTNDITGGNSGSPVINGDGQLIGLAFDGNWEAMSGDYLFEPELQRCINVDIRYVLFIIDKFAGATNLIDELTLVK